PVLAIVLVLGLLIALGALMWRLSGGGVGTPDGKVAPGQAAYVPLFTHLALVLIAGGYLPAPLVVSFQSVAPLLGGKRSGAGCNRQSRRVGRSARLKANLALSSTPAVGGKPVLSWRPAAAPCSAFGGRPMPRICAFWPKAPSAFSHWPARRHACPRSA